MRLIKKIFVLVIILGFFAAISLSLVKTINPKPVSAASCVVLAGNMTISQGQGFDYKITSLTDDHFYFVVVYGSNGIPTYKSPNQKDTPGSNLLTYSIPASAFPSAGTYTVKSFDTTNVNDPCLLPITIRVDTLAPCALKIMGSSFLINQEITARIYRPQPNTVYQVRALREGGGVNDTTQTWTSLDSVLEWIIFIFPGSSFPIEGRYQFTATADGVACSNSPSTITVGTPEPPYEGISGENPCDGGICKTALGDISTSIGPFAQKILSIGIGLAGGIALIIMVIGSIRVLTSAGDPKAVGAGREMIIAAVAGLLFLAFSIVILSFIGIDIIGIPGLGRTLGP
ncbi:MAG: hypothetical protein UT84_C0021G0010 [Candidatus Curtissbacteria bacterium GW2011_GWA1_40_16]|uniref:Uncharacterized protein n=1 Tax=Candidatus Curtissbacteria bacterium GW2011_GWA1_40_16 TaxID=1618405 RepID=A0A0G0RAG4_9BACT|nr:MAG: hypothetical protein UT84_C0021G0010 [Candidatus Curtissbacteria bacterium GW2011_GWA1_40_16]